MTGTLRGLMAWTVIAVALAVAVVIDRPREAVVGSARLFEGFEPDAVERFTIGDTTVVRGDGWRIEGAMAGLADPVVVGDVLGAIELASAERWVSAPPDSAGLSTGRRIVVEAGRTYELVIGHEAAGGQVWARAGGRAALIAGWVARALDRGPAELRQRAIVPTARPTGVELHAGGVDLVTSGDPAVAHLGVGNVRLAPAKARALADALAALRFDSFPTDAAPAAQGTLRVLGGAAIVEVRDLGACGALRRLSTTAGDGCAAGWDAVIAAARDVLDDVTASVDPAPIAEADVERIERGDDVIARRGGGWTLTSAGADVPVDDDAIDALVEVLRARAKVVPLAGAPAPALTLTVTHVGGASERLALIDSVAGPALRRDDEPFALVIAEPDALRASLVDRGLIAEEWSRLSRVLIEQGGRATDVVRGASLDDWTPATAAPFVAALRDLLIDLRAETLGGAAVDAPVRTILVHYDAPPIAGGAPADHELRIAKDCRITVDGATTATLSKDDCAVLLSGP